MAQPKVGPPPVAQPKVVPPRVAQPKVVPPPVTQPKVVPKVTPPAVAQPKAVQPPPVQPKVTPPAVAQPKAVPPKVVPPKVVPPAVAQPKVTPKVDAPKVDPKLAQPKVTPKVDPKVAQPKLPPKVDAPKIDPKVAQPKVTPKVDPKVAQPKLPPKIDAPKVDPKVAQPKVTPKVDPKVAQPKVTPKVDAPKVDPKVAQPKVTPKVDPKVAQPKVTPKVDVTKSNPGKVVPKIDAAKNPPTKADPAKVDQKKLAAAQKAQADSRKKAEEAMSAKSKKNNQELAKAKLDARNDLDKSLTADQKKKAQQAEQARIKKEKELVANKKATPSLVSKDPSKLAANNPTKKTAESARALSLTTGDNGRLIKIKDQIKNPLAQGAIDDALKGKQASPREIAALQAQLNNPNLSTVEKATIASALQNQADIRRQNSFTNSLNGINGNLAGLGPVGPGGFVPPPPGVFPPPGGNAGSAFAGGFVGGLVGGLVGNLVFPGSGVIVPGGFAPGIPLAGGIPFDPGGYTGFIDYGPAVYYPPTTGLDNSGSVIVQTLPCGCSETPLQPVLPFDPNVPPPPPGAVDGNAAIVIDPTSQDVKLTTRYLRLINSSPEKIVVSIVLRTPSGDDGTFVWLPDEPGKSDGAFTIELMPGEEKDVYSNDVQLHGSRARIWGTGETGRTWRQFENVDFWLVPETEEDGTHAYAAPGMETAVYNMK